MTYEPLINSLQMILMMNHGYFPMKVKRYHRQFDFSGLQL